MKSLSVKKIDFTGFSVNQLPQVMDQHQIPFQVVSEINWEEYPYQPAVRFRMAHNGKNILVHYQVEEESIRARYAEDNGMVWTDSCVEFFLRFPEDNHYYNLECNCIGTALLGARKSKNEAVHASLEALQTIERMATLGRNPFELRTGTFAWELTLVVPVAVFFQNPIRDISGMQARGNFYKCGDELLTPHFLSWNRIDHPTPNFHLPEFFGEILFED
jgi:hypothetical protein